jgi:hypothetical protein
MSRGRHLSLEEARKADQLDQFASDPPSIGDEDQFDRLLNRMAKVRPEKDKTSENLNRIKGATDQPVAPLNSAPYLQLVFADNDMAASGEVLMVDASRATLNEPYNKLYVFCQFCQAQRR